MTTKFSHAAKNDELQISIDKTEVTYQPAAGKPYVEPTITIDNLPRISLSRSNSNISAVWYQMMPRWMKISKLGSARRAVSTFAYK